MRVGMIFECGQIGADGKVYPYLAREIRDDIEVIPVFLDSKPKLTEQCGKVAKDLIEIDECEKILNVSLIPKSVCMIFFNKIIVASIMI